MDDLSAYKNLDFDDIDDLDEEQIRVMSVIQLMSVASKVDKLAHDFDIKLMDERAMDNAIDVISGLNAYLNISFGLIPDEKAKILASFINALIYVGFQAGQENGGEPDDRDTIESLAVIASSMADVNRLLDSWDEMDVPPSDMEMLDTIAETMIAWMRTQVDVESPTQVAINVLCRSLYALGRTSDDR